MSAIPTSHNASDACAVSRHTTAGSVLRAECESVVAANAGELALIHNLLLAVRQGPSREEFLAAQEDPLHEPSHHLLVKLDGLLVSHVLHKQRVMQFGEVQLPIAEVHWLATLPEFRSAGYASRLLQAAEVAMREGGAVLALLRTRNPALFRRLGWLECGRPSYLRVGARQLLAQLGAQSLLAAEPRFTTRMWRQVELRSLVEIYNRNTRGAYGPVERSEDYWRWLITRRAYDQIIVAIEGDDNWEYGEGAPRIVGYAVTRQDQIVELLTDPAHPAAAADLVARACGEAIERDEHTLTIHAPPHQIGSQLVLACGGAPCEPPGAAAEVMMMKVLDRDALVTRLYPELQSRSRESHVPRPVHWRVDLDGAPHRFTLSQRSVRFGVGEPSRADIDCSVGAWESLLLSQLALESALESGAFHTRTKALQKTIRALFPYLPLWRAGLDDLAA